MERERDLLAACQQHREELNDLAETEPERAKAMADDWFAWADRTGNKY